MPQTNELNEIKENLRLIDEQIREIKRNQIYIEDISPIETEKMLPLGIFLLLLGFSFAFSTYFGIAFQTSIISNIFTALLSLAFIFAGAKLTKIGFKSRRIARRTKKIVGRAKEIKKRLENEISKQENKHPDSNE